MPYYLTMFFNKYKNNIIQLCYLLMSFALMVSIYKDISYAIPMHCDVRNRIVGARMMEDGLSPYFYICKTGGLLKYQNSGNYTATLSQTTASPFFHAILKPIADLPQFQINTIWLFIEYMAMAVCFLLTVFSIDKGSRSNFFLLIFTIVTIFTFTIGWREHIFNGQNYIFIPLLALGCCYSLSHGYKFFNILIFALSSSSLILIKPIAVLFFLPFLFFPKVYFKWGLATLLTITGYFIFVLFTPVQKVNWVDYLKAIPMHVKHHQQLALNGTSSANVDSFPLFLCVDEFEGVDLKRQYEENNQFGHNFFKVIERSNLYVFYDKYAKNILSIKAMMTIGSFAVVILLLPLFWFIKHSSYCSPIRLLALGFIIYEVFTFCSPILRLNYYWVEFLFPMLIMAIAMKKIYVLPILLTSFGLYLNIAAPIWIPARQNVGEFLILIALLSNVYRPVIVYYLNENKWKINNDMFWL